MSQNKNALLRYRIIDKCLSNSMKSYTFKDIKDEVDRVLLEKNPNYDGISDHQLRVDIRYMISTEGYDAPIIQRKRGRERIYEYESPFSIAKSIMNETELKSLDQAISILRMFEGREDFGWLNEIGPILDDQYIKRSKPIIAYESNLDYTGNELVPFFFNAILNEQVVQFDYEPFGKRSRSIIFHPHYLKQFANRWYIFGKHQNQSQETYHLPLDRIINVEHNYQIEYVSCDIDWDDYFYDIVGVIRYNEQPQDLILHVNKETYPFVQTKPLHPTQKIKKLDSDFYEIRIKIIPNREFIALMLSYGQDITIKEPIHLKDRMRSIINKMKTNYED
jgi:predicted DNA-binding transcriptional regulator YafY